MFDLFKIFRRKTVSITTEETVEQQEKVKDKEDVVVSFNKLTQKIIEEMAFVNSMSMNGILNYDKTSILSSNETSSNNDTIYYGNFEVAYRPVNKETFNTININLMLRNYHNLQLATLMCTIYYLYNKLDLQQMLRFFNSNVKLFSVNVNGTEYKEISLETIYQDIIPDMNFDTSLDLSNNDSLSSETIHFRKGGFTKITEKYTNLYKSTDQYEVDFSLHSSDNFCHILIRESHFGGKNYRVEKDVKIFSLDPMLHNYNIEVIKHYQIILGCLEILWGDKPAALLKKYSSEVKAANFNYANLSNEILYYTHKQGEFLDILQDIFNSYFKNISDLEIFTNERKDNIGVLDSISTSIYQIQSHISYMRNVVLREEIITLVNIDEQINDQDIKSEPLLDYTLLQQYLDKYITVAKLPYFNEVIETADLIELINIILPFITRLKYVIMPSIKNLIELELSKGKKVTREDILSNEKAIATLDKYYQELINELDNVISLCKKKEESVIDNTDELFENYLEFKKQKEMFHVKQSEQDQIFKNIMDKKRG